MYNYRIVIRVWLVGAAAVLLSFLVPQMIDLWEAHQAERAILSEWSRLCGPPPYEPDLLVSRQWHAWTFTFAPKSQANDASSLYLHQGPLS